MKKIFTYAFVFLFVLALVFGLGKAFGGALDSVFAPMQKAIFKTENKIKDFFISKDTAKEYKTENEALKEEVSFLKREIENIKGLKDENIRLRGLLELKNTNKKFNMVFCDVIATETKTKHPYIKVDKGENYKIKINDIAVLNYSLIGKVTKVGKDWAKISLITSPDFSVGVRLIRTGEFGVADAGANLLQNELYLSHIPKETKLLTGDEVVTSGEGSIFPKGLKVGRVSKISNEQTIIDTELNIYGIRELGIIKMGEK